MNAFFPTASDSQSAGSGGAVRAVLPVASGASVAGPMIRLTRTTSADQVFIAFGDATVTATTDSMELISGVVEELENPNTTIYTHFSVITLSGTVLVNVSTGPRYKVG